MRSLSDETKKHFKNTGEQAAYRADNRLTKYINNRRINNKF